MSRVVPIDDDTPDPFSPTRGEGGGQRDADGADDAESAAPRPVAPLSYFRELPERHNAAFDLTELRRVGTAATMVVVCGTIIIITMTMMLGHYNSLAHSGPKAVLDGAVIGLLVGRRGRWRCLALLGIVYGLVLLLQIGVFYLVPVMATAGIVAAGVGRAVSIAHRATAVVVAAIVYELLAGCGAPIKIYFGTGGRHEPFLWGMWFAEWPLRIIGAAAGVWLAGRWRRRRADAQAADDSVAEVDASSPDHDVVSTHLPSLPRARGVGAAALRLSVSILACVVPMMVESGRVLGLLAIASIGYALWAGLRRQIFGAMIGLLWGWLVFGLFSYLWHQDTARVADMLRTLVLRFTPITLASMVLVATTRPVDIVRLLRRCGVSRVILLPLASVIRDLPASRRELRRTMARLRRDGVWTGPLSLFRRPVPVIKGLFGPSVRRWADQLGER